MGPVVGAQVIASWHRVDSDGGFQDFELAGTSDNSGKFTLCGLPSDRPTLVYATASGRESEIVHVLLEGTGLLINGAYRESNQTAAGVGRKDLTLHRRPQSSTTVAGVVTDAVTGQPVADAIVRVDAQNVAHTDSTGTFRVTGQLSGQQSVQVGRAGYRTRSGLVDIDHTRLTVLGAELSVLQPVIEVAGTVASFETKASLEGVWVTLVSIAGDSVSMTRTDSTGVFSVTAPTPGPYYVRAQRLGYGPGFVGPVALDSGRAVNVTLSLQQASYTLDPLTVTAEAVDAYLDEVGFYRRQRGNRGHFMDRAAIEQRLGASRYVSDLLTHLPGANIPADLAGSFGVPINLSRGPTSFLPCAAGGPLLFVDGYRIENTQHGGFGGDQPAPAWISLSEIMHPEDIYAIEVYRTPSQVPIEYGGPDSACGVILFWTKRGTR
jgi:hypothetical protein